MTAPAWTLVPNEALSGWSHTDRVATTMDERGYLAVGAPRRPGEPGIQSWAEPRWVLLGGVL